MHDPKSDWSVKVHYFTFIARSPERYYNTGAKKDAQYLVPRSSTMVTVANTTFFIFDYK